MAKILGIDLGTTNSAMAVMEGGEPQIVENSEGARTTPSIVAISKKGERLVGNIAKRQAITNPQNTVYGIKRFVGHKFSDQVVQKDKDIVPYELSEGENGGVQVTMGEKKHRPEEISAMILSKLKRDAEEKTGEEVTEAVITVPAYFDDAQRKATQAAGKIAGLEVKRIINEPTAAALAYGFNKKKNEQIAVYDFGGGTFDISILEVGDDEDESTIEVKATDGDSHMGGRDIDQKIITWIADQFKNENGIDLRKDPLAVQRLDEAAEKAKHELSTTTETEINIPFITSDEEGPKHLALTLSRQKLEELAREFIERSIEITKRTVEASPFDKGDIDEVILVGGQTRMPAIAEAVKDFFGKEPNKSINPDEVVALGAAIQGGVLSGDVKDVLLLDVTPLSLGIETMGGVATKLIEKNTTIPASRSQIFSTATDNQQSVEIHVVQGEREMAADNKSLGRFVLDGINPAPRGTPQIEVTFDINRDGVLEVKAVDKATNKEQSIKIEASSGLSDDEIEKMKQDAEKHAEEDKKKKEVAEAKNTAEQAVYAAEKLMNEAPEAPQDVKDGVKKKIDDVKELLQKPDMDTEQLKSEATALHNEAQKLASHQKQTDEQAQSTQQQDESGEQHSSNGEEKDDNDNKDSGDSSDEGDATKDK